MAGIYIHIPFCRQKCYYCDFYKTVNTSLTEKFLTSLKEESLMRNEYLINEKVETIYFGGGTPSVLTIKQLSDILEFLNKEFQIEDEAEITLEANPDDLDYSYLKGLYQIGINRLSIGLQALQDEHLKKMNRRHNAEQAISSIKNTEKVGFQNVSIDLIYGLQELTSDQWKDTLQQVFKLSFQHLSAYHLTYHQGTPFYTWLKKGSLREMDEQESLEQFEILIEIAGKFGFEHYEISNFAKDQLYSKHNTSYWTGKKYLGLGPSAHSFDGKSRQWNIASLEGYIKAIENSLPFFEEEVLTENEKFNEFILTRLRTKWGISKDELRKNFGKQKLDYFQNEIKKYLNSSLVEENDDTIIVTKKGLFISDEIVSNLMII